MLNRIRKARAVNTEPPVTRFDNDAAPLGRRIEARAAVGPKELWITEDETRLSSGRVVALAEGARRAEGDREGLVWHRHSCLCQHRQECLCHTMSPCDAFSS